MKLMQILERLIGRGPEQSPMSREEEEREQLHAEVQARLARQEARLRALDVQVGVQARTMRTKK